jgi:16S rRNA (cytosine967-C5)-methyltransferase
MKKRIAPARQAAFDVLEQVAAGGYASDLLRDATRNLSARDAGLTGQLLRVQNQLDYLIEKYSGRAVASLDLAVQMALRVGIFQIRYLERVPPHAAVDDSVEFVKQRKRAASGLTNAVLRKSNRDSIEWPDEALRYAIPDWLLNRWKTHFGAEKAIGIAMAALKEPEQFIRFRSGESLPDGLKAEPTTVEGCYRLLSPVAEGIRLHDISSQAIVPLLGLQASHAYLDLCAAPGNKAAQALEARPKLAIACDISEWRLQTVNSVANRIVLDASEQLPFDRSFDRVLIDAPCSGTGTIGRNPEIKWRLKEADLQRQHARQVNILKRAASALSPGGKIVYATCSLEEEENEAVVREATATSGLVSETAMWRLPGRDLGDGFYAALLVKTGSLG